MCKKFKLLGDFVRRPTYLDICQSVNQGRTIRNRCTQRLVILHAQAYTNEPRSRARNQVSLRPTGQIGPRKKWV